MVEPPPRNLFIKSKFPQKIMVTGGFEPSVERISTVIPANDPELVHVSREIAKNRPRKLKHGIIVR